MARITRKELKTDRFAVELGHTVTLFEEHQKQIIRYGGIALAAILLIVGYVLYRGHQHTVRQEALSKAVQVQEAPISANPNPNGPSFPTQDAKDQASVKAFTDLQKTYAGSDEAEIAAYYLAGIKADQGQLAQAEKSYLEVAQRGDDKYSSLAKLALAQIYYSDGREAQGEKMLRDLMDHPTIFVSRDQAALTLARYLLIKNPNEARKLLDTLRNQKGAVGQTALTLYSELPPQ